VAPPAIDPKRIPTVRDQRLREQLGIAPDDRIILAPGESTKQAGHKLALHATSILHVLDKRCRLLLWGRGREIAAVAWLGTKLRQDRLTIDAEQRLGRAIEFEQLLLVADVALVTPGVAAPVLPIALCMAAGLPIIAGDGPLVREILPPESATIVPNGPRSLSQTLMRSFENPDEPRQAALAAQHLAQKRFSESAFVAAHHSLYCALATAHSLELTRSPA
jgi:glycosyltransferase involved in cell wall biosynthesis